MYKKFFYKLLRMLSLLTTGIFKYVNQLKRIFMYFLSKADSFNLVWIKMTLIYSFIKIDVSL